MSELFELSMPWWEFVLRALVVYVALLVMVRISGKRTIGQFTAFDMILLVLLGTAVQNSLIGEDVSLLGGLILAATLIALNYLVALITSRSRSADLLVEGEPVVLARDGQLFRSVLKREMISEDDFNEALRQNGEMTLTDVRVALLETNGMISVVKRESDGGKPSSKVPDAANQASPE